MRGHHARAMLPRRSTRCSNPHFPISPFENIPVSELCPPCLPASGHLRDRGLWAVTEGTRRRLRDDRSAQGERYGDLAPICGRECCGVLKGCVRPRHLRMHGSATDPPHTLVGIISRACHRGRSLPVPQSHHGSQLPQGPAPGVAAAGVKSRRGAGAGGGGMAARHMCWSDQGWILAIPCRWQTFSPRPLKGWTWIVALRHDPGSCLAPSFTLTQGPSTLSPPTHSCAASRSRAAAISATRWPRCASACWARRAAPPPRRRPPPSSRGSGGRGAPPSAPRRWRPRHQVRSRVRWARRVTPRWAPFTRWARSCTTGGTLQGRRGSGAPWHSTRRASWRPATSMQASRAVGWDAFQDEGLSRSPLSSGCCWRSYSSCRGTEGSCPRTSVSEPPCQAWRLQRPGCSQTITYLPPPPNNASPPLTPSGRVSLFLHENLLEFAAADAMEDVAASLLYLSDSDVLGTLRLRGGCARRVGWCAACWALCAGSGCDRPCGPRAPCNLGKGSPRTRRGVAPAALPLTPSSHTHTLPHTDPSQARQAVGPWTRMRCQTGDWPQPRHPPWRCEACATR